MQHNYTDEEIRTAWKDSLSLHAFLDALPDRPHAQAGLWPGQQEAIDKAFEQIDDFYLDCKSSCDDWNHEAPARLAIAQAYDAARPQAAEIAALKDALLQAQEAAKDLLAQRDKAHAELAAAKGEGQAQGVPQVEQDPYAELKAAHAAGKIIQMKLKNEPDDTWDDILDPGWGLDPDEYRIKPEPAQSTTSPSWTPTVGDVVRLKSGGSVMVVTGVDPLSLMCAWMNASNELQVEPITTLCLEPAQP